MTTVFITSGGTSPYNIPGDWTDAGHVIELVGAGGQSGAASTGTSGRGGGGGGGAAYAVLTYSSGTLSSTTAFYVGINSATTANGTAIATKWGSNSNTVVTNSYYAEAGRAGSTTSQGVAGSGTTVLNGTPPTPAYTTTSRTGGNGGTASAVAISGGAGGGGAAGTGPAATGGNGGASGGTAGNGGGGGGAGNNNSAGGTSSSATGGAGGTGVGPSHGGGAGSSTTSGGNGSAGIGGQGGGGGCGFTTTTASQTCSGYAGGTRGNVSDWVQTSDSATAGAGAGGGGGGGASGNVATASAGGAGGNYGGGGGGAGGTRGANSGGLGTGASGLIVITYTAGPYVLAALGSSYTITGTAAALLRKQVAAGGAYALTGTAAGLAFTDNMVFAADGGAHTITGTAASFVVVGGAVVLAADAGAYTVTGQSANFVVSDTSLVLHYKFDDTVTTDSSGNSNTGTLAGSGTTLITGQIGSALSFNGSGWVTLSSVSLLGLTSATSEISVSAWIKTSQVTSTILELRNSGNGNTLLDFVIGDNGLDNAGTGKPSVIIRDDGGAGLKTVNAATAINNNLWHHVAYTRNSSKLITIYIDGVSSVSGSDTITGAITPNLAGASIAYRIFTSNVPLVGSLDDLRVYNRALTSTEVAALYTAGTATPFTLTAAAGNYNINLIATQAALRLGHVAAGSSYTLTGAAATFAIKQTAAAGAYTITGTAANLGATSNVVLPAAAGAYTITGTAANFVTTSNVVLPAAGGAYNITGTAANFVTTSNVVLPAAGGAYNITGTAANFVTTSNAVLPAAGGAYTISGTAATFAIKQTAAAGAYTITGTAAAFLTAVSGTAALNDQKDIVASAGGIVGTGTAAFSDQKDLLSAAGNVGSGYDTATDAWIAAVEAATGIGVGTVSTARKGIVDILIRGLKTDGLFAKLDRLWIFAAENRKSALVDMIATQLAVETTSAITFTVDWGYRGLFDYLATNYTPSTAGGNYTVSSSSFGLWSLTAAASDYPAVSSIATAPANLYPRNNSGNLNYSIQSSSSENVTNSDATGFWAVNRDSFNTTQVYRNGSVFYGAGSANAIANPDQPFTVLGDGLGNIWPGDCAGCFFSGKLTATEQANFYTRLNDYMGMVGVVTPTAISGTAAVSDQRDVVAAAGSVDWRGTAAFSDQKDTVASSGGVVEWRGTAALLEGADTVAATGTVAVTTVDGVGALLEGADTIAVTGSVFTGATAALQDIADTASAAGTVAFVPVTGTAALLETADTAAASVTVFIVVTGTAALQETADTAAAVGNIINNGVGTLLEGADTVAATGSVTAAGVAVVTGSLLESRDTVSAAGSVTGEVIGVPPGGGAGAGAGGGRGAHPLYRRILLRRKRRKQRELEEASPPTLPIEREPVPFVPQPSLLQGLVKPPDPVQQLLQNAIVLAVEAEQDDEDAIAVLLEVL